MITRVKNPSGQRQTKVENKEIVMKKILCAMLAAICTVAVSAGFPSNSEAQSKKVLVQLAWVIGGAHTGCFVAQEKGFYAARGLDVTINRGFGSGNTAQIVAARKAEDEGPRLERQFEESWQLYL